MAAAYVFIQGKAEDPRPVVQALRGVSGVKQAHALAGPTDFVVYVEGADQAAIEETLLAIRKVGGVASTDTRFVVLD
ncbi:MAG: hypothetical protein GTO14_09840 [Anaerolineales bacterium]|nr:hypothetical protein [Anaerolineales bacterium]